MLDRIIFNLANLPLAISDFVSKIHQQCTNQKVYTLNIPNISKNIFSLITPRNIAADRLKTVINKFFQVNEEETIVDRLMAETFASQESNPDPVGDVLGPMEKVTLQNESNLGRVIEKPVDLNLTTTIEDQTLKEYKEALLSNYQKDEDLPLSGSNNPMKEIQNLGRKRIPKRKINEDDEENRPRLRTGVRTKRAKTKA